MALIGAYDEEPRKQNPNCAPGVQRYLAYLESTVRGTPGLPVENPVPFELVEATELVDGIPPEPEPPKRKRRAPRRFEMPASGRDAVSLARFARKLKGEP